MSDPHRHDDGSLASETDRESRIEELLLAGLDHYFNGQHELAINVWTRVLFLDRSHAEARAYIERARGAIAERQREGEELLHTGAAAFDRGDASAARQLLMSAVERGAPAEEALALLDRLDRLAPASAPADVRPRPRRRSTLTPDSDVAPRTGRALTLVVVLGVGLAAGAFAVLYSGAADAPWLPGHTGTAAVTLRPPDDPLPVPAVSEVWLSRAKSSYSNGRLRDALAALEAVRAGDPLRAEADALRTAIQRDLLAQARAAARAAVTVSAPPPR